MLYHFNFFTLYKFSLFSLFKLSFYSEVVLSFHNRSFLSSLPILSFSCLHFTLNLNVVISFDNFCPFAIDCVFLSRFFNTLFCVKIVRMFDKSRLLPGNILSLNPALELSLKMQIIRSFHNSTSLSWGPGLSFRDFKLSFWMKII